MRACFWRSSLCCCVVGVLLSGCNSTPNPIREPTTASNETTAGDIDGFEAADSGSTPAAVDEPIIKMVAATQPETDEPQSGGTDESDAEQAELHPAMLDPSLANETAPPSFKAKFETSKGDFVVEVTREWAPLGADRFYNLVKIGYFSDVRFFRCVPNFVVQWGMHGDTKVHRAWMDANIRHEETKVSNKRGYITFAQGGPHTRSNQVFINLRDNASLDNYPSANFPPFGKVVEGMEVVDKLYNGYGDRMSQGAIIAGGNEYLNKNYPRLDFIKSATILGE